MSDTPPTRSTIADLLNELAFQKELLDYIYDTVEDREQAVEEAQAEIRNLVTRILELKHTTTTAASNPEPTRSVDERDNYSAPSLISSTKLKVEIDHINLALQNASMECLGARSVAESVEEESCSMDYHSDNTHPLSEATPVIVA